MYYRGAGFDPASLRSLGWPGEIFPIGGWGGGVFNGGAWLTAGTRRIDVQYRDLDDVAHHPRAHTHAAGRAVAGDGPAHIGDGGWRRSFLSGVSCPAVGVVRGADALAGGEVARWYRRRH